VFKFVVASRNVGFHIYKLRSFSCEHYQIFFNLWNDGGAHWQSESERYFREEDSQWTKVVNRKGRKNLSYADVVRNLMPVSVANVVPLGHADVQRSSAPRILVF
jgi:hypothetical protein